MYCRYMCKCNISGFVLHVQMEHIKVTYKGNSEVAYVQVEHIKFCTSCTGVTDNNKDYVIHELH